MSSLGIFPRKKNFPDPVFPRHCGFYSDSEPSFSLVSEPHFLTLLPVFAAGIAPLGSVVPDKQTEDALDALSKQITENPSDSKALLKRATIYLRTKHLELARADAEKAKLIEQNSFEIAYLLGKIYAEMRQYESALTSFSEAIAANREHASAFIRRGIVLYHMKRLSEAAKDFDWAIALMPDYYKAYYYAGVVLYDMKELKKALFTLNRAIELNPQHQQSFFQRGLVQHDLKHYEASVRDYSTVITLNPKSGAAYYNRAFEKIRTFD
jgi:tetratricopeptide (TPR) repeat protein